MRNDYDSEYRLLFSHPEMVRDLLRGYVPGDWIEVADFSTLERINASYVSESSKQRHDDMVWRLRLNGRWVWIYLLLEFQSEPDTWMALRMLVYLGLLAQDLVNRNELIETKLPPILPLVLYNGLPAWHAALNVEDLFTSSPPGLESFRPRLVYHLIDEARLKLHPAQSVRTAVDALFRLEQSRTPEDLRTLIQSLNRLLNDPTLTQLRRTFTIWIKRLLQRKALPVYEHEINQIKNLTEADTMLAERIDMWFEEKRQQGLQQGIQEGLQQGMQQGMNAGRKAEAARLLERQLRHRFGDLPAAIAQRLQDADIDQLETWSERLLDAHSLDEALANK